ncbi:MAG: TonB-dependent receptor [Spirochaetaceae bacterium]|jgi:iron complex outermembrane receptor protein|nr:TonB-dependent receptor [Spirochaetaceae bacterium]GMO27291.1 MAG: TonB-dependent receptor [Termitinemataceae bacterium]
MRRIFFLFAAFVCLPALFSQESETPEVVLPSAKVSAEKENVNKVTQDDMERENSTDLWEALRNVPGVIRSGGGSEEDESGFRVRGFDSSRFPVYVDDIPLENPYRGNIDFARFLTGDLESAEVQKGFSSMLAGSNTMGGALFLRTAKPKAPFELQLKTSADFDSLFSYSGIYTMFALGTKQELFYTKFFAQFRAVDHTTLSASFTPIPDNPQKKGRRLYSESDDIKLTMLAGWTPNAGFSLNFEYIFSGADKGKSPPEVNKTNIVIFAWPLYQRHTIKIDADYFGMLKTYEYYGKAFFYFDKFDTEQTQDGIYFRSITNDDYIFGFRLEGGFIFNQKNELKAAFNFKHESHTRLNDSIKNLNVEENTFSLGAEYELKPFFFWARYPLSLRAGAGFDALQPVKFVSTQEKDQTKLRYMFSLQAGAFFDITPKHTLRVTWSKKNHIPSMYQRYENLFEDIWDDSVPNPNLKNEAVYHYEAGYRGIIAPETESIFAPVISIDAAVYYADLYDMISAATVDTPTGGSTLMRVNIDKTAYYGFETGITINAGKYVELGGMVSVNRYNLIKAASGYQIENNFPRTQASVYLTLTPFAGFSPLPLQTLAITPAFEYEGPRYSRWTRLGAGEIIDRWTLVSLKLNLQINKNWSFAAYIENIFDVYYCLDSAYLPQSGRSFSFSVSGKY